MGHIGLNLSKSSGKYAYRQVRKHVLYFNKMNRPPSWSSHCLFTQASPTVSDSLPGEWAAEAGRITRASPAGSMCLTSWALPGWQLLPLRLLSLMSWAWRPQFPLGLSEENVSTCRNLLGDHKRQSLSRQDQVGELTPESLTAGWRHWG